MNTIILFTHLLNTSGSLCQGISSNTKLNKVGNGQLLAARPAS